MHRAQSGGTILVTGASGKTGRAVVRALAKRGERVRALVFHAEQAAGVERLGADDVVVGDMREPRLMARACSRARAVYHIPPNVHPEEVEIGDTAIGAARSAGVDHFVYHSVLLPAVEEMPHHWLKHRVEQRLIASGLRCTILRPCAYMQNVLAEWNAIRAEGVFRVPYGSESRMSLVDLADVAEAAAEVLSRGEPGGATYELCGPDPLTPVGVAGICARILGKPVRVKVVDVGSWEEGARAAGLGEYQVEALVRMFRYYDRHGFAGDPQPLAGLLGRLPTSFGEFLERMCGDPSGGRDEAEPGGLQPEAEGDPARR